MINSNLCLKTTGCLSAIGLIRCVTKQKRSRNLNKTESQTNQNLMKLSKIENESMLFNLSRIQRFFLHNFVFGLGRVEDLYFEVNSEISFNI